MTMTLAPRRGRGNARLAPWTPAPTTITSAVSVIDASCRPAAGGASRTRADGRRKEDDSDRSERQPAATDPLGPDALDFWLGRWLVVVVRGRPGNEQSP